MKKFAFIFFTLQLIIVSTSTKIYGQSFTENLKNSKDVKLFFPGVVSQRNVIQYNSSFSDDGKYLVYTFKGNLPLPNIMLHKYKKGNFSKGELIFKDTLYSYGDSHISGDGKSLFVTSNRPLNKDETISSTNNIWKYEKSGNEWVNPQLIKFDLGFTSNNYYPSITKNGNLYFCSINATNRNADIYSAKFENDKYKKGIKLPEHINTANFEGDPFVDRKERFIIFAGFGREENYGLSDLYITFKTEDGWSKVINLGKEINSHGFDGSPYITVDDKFLIFTSSRHPEKENEQERFNVFYTNFDLEKYKKLAGVE